MNFSTPANWDIGLLDKLKAFPVTELYGMPDNSIVGGGRPSIVLPAVSRKNIKAYISRASSQGIGFNYLLNAPCLNNLECTKSFRRKLIKQLGWLHDIGVESVTVALPYLIESVKKEFPGFKVTVSAIANINSVQKARLFAEMGVDEITLPMSTNRDFSLLQSIRKAVKCNLRLILNDMCLYQCPFMFHHYNIIGHASQTTNPLGGFYIDYCLMKCSVIRFGRPEEIIKSRWIRPEDLHEYEGIGIDTFKIAGRTKPSGWIVNVLSAYSSRSYGGNLIDLIDCVESPVPQAYRGGSWKYRGKISGLKRYISLWKMKAFLQFLMRFPIGLYGELPKLYYQANRLSESIYIDNKKLNGFLDRFKHIDCDTRCSQCDYCKKWSDVAVNIVNKDEIDKYINLLQKILARCV